jgi:hypothetical protein
MSHRVATSFLFLTKYILLVLLFFEPLWEFSPKFYTFWELGEVSNCIVKFLDGAGEYHVEKLTT